MEMAEIRNERGFAASSFDGEKQPCCKCGEKSGYPNITVKGVDKYECDECARKGLNRFAISLLVVLATVIFILIVAR